MTGLLGIKEVTDETREGLVSNIIRVWNAATPDQRKRGADWYPEANRIALALSQGPSIGAGIIAALSANKAWDANVQLAEDAVAGVLIRHTKDSARKAERILAGESPDEVLPQGLKTWNFYRNILIPVPTLGSPQHDPVTIDRHAHDVAMGLPYGSSPRGLSSPKRYEVFADAYRTAAVQLAVPVSVLQATTWLTWREQPRGVRGQ
jgi:hypothetical protein